MTDSVNGFHVCYRGVSSDGFATDFIDAKDQMSGIVHVRHCSQYCRRKQRSVLLRN